MSEHFFLGHHAFPHQGRTLVMGILNVTPDSFSDGGRHLEREAAIARGLELAAQGADLIDVGGESTRPGAPPVDAATEAARVVPVIAALADRLDLPLSIDTTKPEVAEEALRAGASLINDVNGLRQGDELARLAASAGASLVLMHSRGSPETMQTLASYHDLVQEVKERLAEAAAAAQRAGVPARSIVVDPGLGFAKDAAGNLTLLHRVSELVDMGYPVLVGPSRKSFIGAATGKPVGERLMGTAAACVAAILGGARIVRIHDVAELLPALRMAEAIREERLG
ncbi:MAG: dihydropteroate synthase [Deltaproteobacteria bacterium]|nr:dihydropteroate synthase [Deltaproteobacteria bacterium]